MKTGSALATSSLFFPTITRAENLGAPKLRIAVIGVGGRGIAHVNGYQSEEIVAFCYVDDLRAAKTYNRFPDVPRFRDYRVMFDKMGDSIDAVSIAVPDHMHYPVALRAIKQGKHILVEKPLVRTVEEAMLLKAEAQKSGVITQMGNQGHANDGLRKIQEWIEAGVIGEVTEAYHWTNRPVWPQGMSAWPAAAPTPETIDWDLWLGVAPRREFSPGIAPFKWRGFREYGCGAIGDIACHAMDASYTTLNLGYPTTVTSHSEQSSEVAFPTKSTIVFEFPANEKRGTIKVTWMDGKLRPKGLPFVPDDFINGKPKPEGGFTKGQENGSVLLGSKGAIFTDMYAKNARIFPHEYFREISLSNGLPTESLPRVAGGHFAEWVEACKQGVQPGANIADYAADFTATALLGAASLGLNDQKLTFDAKTMRFTNSDAANARLTSSYDYRKEFIAG